MSSSFLAALSNERKSLARHCLSQSNGSMTRHIYNDSVEIQLELDAKPFSINDIEHKNYFIQIHYHISVARTAVHNSLECF